MAFTADCGVFLLLFESMADSDEDTNSYVVLGKAIGTVLPGKYIMNTLYSLEFALAETRSKIICCHLVRFNSFKTCQLQDGCVLSSGTKLSPIRHGIPYFVAPGTEFKKKELSGLNTLFIYSFAKYTYIRCL